MSFSFLCWNVRHFRGDKARLKDADRLITDLDPDLFALLEFETQLAGPAPSTAPQNNRAAARELMIDRFPEYDFAVTDSEKSMEVIVGYRRKRFDQVIFTQRRAFQATPGLRPGALLSVNEADSFYTFLFLHLDSGTKKSDHSNRQKMYKKIWSLNKVLAKAAKDGKPNLIAIGDLNTMGVRGGDKGKQEIAKLTKAASRNGMRLLSKDQDYTWHRWGRDVRTKNPKPLRIKDLKNAMKSNLDHVIASKEIDLADVGRGGEKVHVRGWNQLEGQDRIDFLWSLSDHSALFGKVR